MRHLLLPLLSFGALACQAAPPPPNCLVESETNNSKVVACAAPRAGQVFAANFSGGHDDTDVGIKPAIEGMPDACLPGSKLSSFGEDGDIRLHCTVAGSAAPAGNGPLRVVIRWSHAQFTDFALEPGAPAVATPGGAAGKSP